MYENIKPSIFYAKDFIDVRKTDSQIIKDCFDFALPFTNKTIVIDTKNWHIDAAILIPENTTVIVDGVTIKQNDGVFDNIFRSDNFVIDESNPNGFPLSITPISNIKIIGENGAKLEGPDVNATVFHPTQKTVQNMVGDYWGWRGLQVCLSRVSGFELSGFVYEKQRSWANSFDRCSYGYIHNLSFNSTVKNGDGINIRLGCHDIKIQNISGMTSDDLIAINSMTVGTVYPSKQYVYPIDPGSYLINKGEESQNRDIYNIAVNNVVSSTSLYSHAIALLSRNGHKIYNIQIDNVTDGNPISISNRLAIVGTYRGYASGYTVGDLHTVRINNVVSNSAEKAVVLNDIVDDFWINKVTQNRADGITVYALDMAGVTLTNS